MEFTRKEDDVLHTEKGHPRTSFLQGKVVIVTRVASGIGRASAILFAWNGASVVGADVDAQGGLGVVHEISKNGGRALFVKTDVSVASEARDCVEAAAKKFGELDCLFSNAGINPAGMVVDTMEELWDRVLSVNLKGTFLMCKYAISAMKKAGKGSIVCTGSVDGVLAIHNEAAYIASKGGLISLVRAMALDHAKENIGVNCILLGAIRTPLYDRLTKQAEMPGRIPGEDPQANQHAMGRIGEPEEVAQIAMFLLSDIPSFVTGSVIPVDGGYSTVKI